MRLTFVTSYKADKQYQVGVLYKPTATAAAAHRLLAGTTTTTTPSHTTTTTTTTTSATTTSSTAGGTTVAEKYCTNDPNGDHWDGFLTSYDFKNATFDPHHVVFEIEDLFPVVPSNGVWRTNINGTNSSYLIRDCHDDWKVKDSSTIECDPDHCTYTIWVYRPLTLHSYEDFDLTPAEI